MEEPEVKKARFVNVFALILAVLLANGIAEAAVRIPMNFSPYVMANTDPTTGNKVSAANIAKYGNIVAPYASLLITFESAEVPDALINGGVVVKANSTSTTKPKLAITIWISGELEDDARQIMAAARLMKAGWVTMIFVGSENLQRGGSEDLLISYLRVVKPFANAHGVKVATSDTWNQLMAHPKVVAECDLIAANMYPYWEGISIEHSVCTVRAHFAELKAAYPGKEIFIREAGWPTAGQINGSAVPSLANSALFAKMMYTWSRASGISVAWFEAFDEPWKVKNEGEAGAHWGMWGTDLKLKAGFMDVFNGVSTPFQCPVAAPTSLTGKALGYTSIQLDWKDNSTNEVGFTVERQDPGLAFKQIKKLSAGTVTFSDTGLKQDTQYIYRVSAYSSEIASSYSNTVTVKTTALPTVAAPTDLKAAANSATEATLTWKNNATNEDAVSIEQKGPGDSTFKAVKRLGKDVVTLKVTGLKSEAAYQFRVIAIISSLNVVSAYSNIADVTMPKAPMVWSGTIAYSVDTDLFFITPTGVKQISDGTTGYGANRWSPDGKYLACRVTTDANNFGFQLDFMTKDGMIARSHMLSRAIDRDLGWTNDSSAILVGQYADGLFYAPLDGDLAYKWSGPYLTYEHNPKASPDGEWIYFVYHTWGTSGQIMRWATDDFLAGTGSPVAMAGFSTAWNEDLLFEIRPDGKLIVGYLGQIGILDPDSETAVGDRTLDPVVPLAVGNMRLSPNGKYLAATVDFTATKLVIYDAMTLEIVKEITIPNLSIMTVAWSPDSSSVAMVCSDKSVNLYRLADDRSEAIYSQPLSTMPKLAASGESSWSIDWTK